MMSSGLFRTPADLKKLLRALLQHAVPSCPGNWVWKVIEPESSTAMMNDGGAETFRFIGCCDNVPCACAANRFIASQVPPDRKSTRLNSSHSQISYAVFCLKKKKRVIALLIRYEDDAPT